MSAAALKELLDDRAIVMPLTVEQYHRMIETGTLTSGDPIELLDGFLVRKDRSAAGADPMTVGHAHALVISKLGWALGGPQDGWHLRLQSPVTFLPDNEPEPDGAIIAGAPDDHPERHPSTADISCLIEVGESPLRRDRVTKQRIYAEAGVLQYLIANIVDDLVEVYSEPDLKSGEYRHVQPYRRGERVRLNLPGGGTIELPVETFLP
jgi:hypothetical protein